MILLTKKGPFQYNEKMTRLFPILCTALLLASTPGLAQEKKQAAAPPSPTRPTLVAWENGRPAGHTELKGGALIAWEPGRFAEATSEPAGPILPGPMVARQFDVEEYPILPKTAAIPPTKIVPVTTAFSPYSPPEETSRP